MFQEYNYLFKIVVIGDSGVGKTNLVSKFIDSSFHLEEKPTVGVQFASKTVKIGQHDIRCQIWDTAGQQRFRAITKAYYNGAVGALVVFDLTASQTFTNVSKWIQQAEQNTKANTLILLIGNKSDLQNRQISQAKIDDFLSKCLKPILYMQTSALTGLNVNEAFTKLIEKIYTTKKVQLDAIKAKAHTKQSSVPSEFAIESPKRQQSKGVTLKSQNFMDKTSSPSKDPTKKKRKKCC